jgi:hypothetical protein
MAPVLITALGELFGGLISAVDDWHTSDEEKLEAKGKIFASQAALLAQVFEYERSIMEAKSNIIVAEAKGDGMIQRNWRPVTMLTFVALIVARWMGWVAPGITPELESQLMTLVQIGLGGYVIGRSAEKVAKSINFNKTIATED